jgi:hypothetical protein
MKVSPALIVAGIIAAVVLPVFLSRPPDNTAGPAIQDLPWQIEIQQDGSTLVFGLTPGKSSLGDARNRFGSNLELALVAAPGESGDIEAYFADVTLGAVTGKLIVTADLPTEVIEKMRERVSGAKYMNSNTKKWSLAGEDETTAYAAPIRAIAFIPSANLDEQIILQRFGRPGERIRTSEHIEHFLYPERGLDLALDSDGKELLQYVPPSRFPALRAPLLEKSETREGTAK